MKQAGIHKCLGIRQCCDHFHADPGILIFIIVTIKEVWLNYCFYSLKNSIFLSENHFFFIIVVEMEHRITNLFCDVGKFNRSNRFRINNSDGLKKKLWMLARCSWLCSTVTPTTWCTGTSSRRTSCWTRTWMWSWPILGLPRCWAPMSASMRCAAPPAIWRPNYSGEHRILFSRISVAFNQGWNEGRE